jgi:hypothetical protein
MQLKYFPNAFVPPHPNTKKPGGGWEREEFSRPRTPMGSGRRVKAVYECVSKSFRTGRLERELQMVQLSATRCSCTLFLWATLASFAIFVLLLNE